MRYQCTLATDLHELIGQDGLDGFQYGPLSFALKHGEDLISDVLMDIEIAHVG